MQKNVNIAENNCTSVAGASFCGRSALEKPAAWREFFVFTEEKK